MEHENADDNYERSGGVWSAVVGGGFMLRLGFRSEGGYGSAEGARMAEMRGVWVGVSIVGWRNRGSVRRRSKVGGLR